MERSDRIYIEQLGVADTRACQTDRGIPPLFNIVDNTIEKLACRLNTLHTRISFHIGISNPLFHYAALQTAMMHRTAIFFTTNSPGTFLPCSLIYVMAFPSDNLLASSIGFQPARSFRRWALSFLLSLLMPSIKLAFSAFCKFRLTFSP